MNKEAQNYLDDEYDRQKDAKLDIEFEKKQEQRCEWCKEKIGEDDRICRADDGIICEGCYEQAYNDCDMREYDEEYQQCRAEFYAECSENGGIGR